MVTLDTGDLRGLASSMILVSLRLACGLWQSSRFGRRPEMTSSVAETQLVKQKMASETSHTLAQIKSIFQVTLCVFSLFLFLFMLKTQKLLGYQNPDVVMRSTQEEVQKLGALNLTDLKFMFAVREPDPQLFKLAVEMNHRTADGTKTKSQIPMIDCSDLFRKREEAGNPIKEKFTEYNPLKNNGREGKSRYLCPETDSIVL